MLCGSGPASRSRLLSCCFREVGLDHGKRTVGWIKGPRLFQLHYPWRINLHYVYLVKGGRLLSYSTRPSTHPFDRLHRTASSNSNLFIIHCKDRVLLIHSPLHTYSPNLFHSIDVHLLAELTPSLVDRHSTTSAPLSSHPFKPLETGLSLV